MPGARYLTRDHTVPVSSDVVLPPDGAPPDLNPAQAAAIYHAGGPLLVLAGAGSGKTRVLTYRIAHLIRSGRAGPYEILAITFTNKAAAEMKARVVDLVGPVAATMWVSTFHSACARMLRREAALLGYRSGFTIYDQDDQVRLVKQCLEDLGYDVKRFPPRAVHAPHLGRQEPACRRRRLRPAARRATPAGPGRGLVRATAISR